MTKTPREVHAPVSFDIPTAHDIVRLASSTLSTSSPLSNPIAVDESLTPLLRQIEAMLGQLEIFLVPTKSLPPKIAGLPLIGSTWIGGWLLRIYNRLFQRQQVTNRQLIEVLRVQSQVISQLARRDRGGR